ncbi:thioredoxin family protein [Chitinophagaceae bacterium MMS25-I14]
MKKLLIILGACVLMSFTNWQSGFEQAKQQAKERHQLILLNFSGSDWCGPCIRMHKEIFESAVFSNLADSALIVINADFPRNKKNQPDLQTKKRNEALADRYNAEGKFPFTVLLNADGKIIKSWEGLPKESAVQFTGDLKTIYDAQK